MVADSVGADAANRRRDVAHIADALGRVGLLDRETGSKAADGDRAARHDFEGAIRAFQLGNELAPDGVIKPDGATIKALVRETSSTKAIHAPGRDKEAEQTELQEARREMAGQATSRRANRALLAMSQREQQFKSAGLREAAANMKHYLSATGTPKRYTRDQARAFKPVRKIEEKNRRQFEESTFLGFGNKSSPAALQTMKDGETIEFTDNQSANSDEIDFAKNLLVADRDAALAIGRTSAITEGDFTAKRTKDKILISGTATFNWHDEYDFHPLQPGSADAKALEKDGAAMPFDFGATWRQDVEAVVRIIDGKLTLEKVEWRDSDD